MKSSEDVWLIVFCSGFLNKLARVHIEKEPSGRTIITPVNPMAELQRLSSQGQGDVIIQNMNGKMIEQLELTTARA